MNSSKKKIINDPIYGFVTIPSGLIFELIEHPYFQRLRRIKQLGLSNLVYPGALHTRFQHVIGAMWLCSQSIEILKSKGIEISDDEETAVCAAVLLHDMGHGPFSHTLEGMLVSNVSHEKISIHFMHLLNEQLNGKLDLCIKIFSNQYHKKFLHQLVSSQLDMDRLDYLRRDSFFTGVQEGVIGHDRIINMLNVSNDELVIEEKGIYSVEKFLIARRLMYWQVYLHKTVIAAETLLVKIITRAKELADQKNELFATPAFAFFLYNKVDENTFFTNKKCIENYSMLDDSDILTSVKVWQNHSDEILSTLCSMLCNRNLPKIEISNTKFDSERINILQSKLRNQNDSEYLVYTDSVKNEAYSNDDFHINILYKNGTLLDITQASDQYNIEALSKTVTKYFLCYPKNL